MRPANPFSGPPALGGPVRIDLHTHSTVSDGTLTPAQLVAHARERGLAALALTDHDHVGGLAEARREGERLGVEVVAGVELSAEDPEAGELHLLGYLFDEEDPALLARLEALRDARALRGARMVERLREAGLDVSLDEVVREVAPGASLGRPHVARVLVAKGHAASIEDAFDRWLGEGRPGHVPKERLAPEEAMGLIHAAGGVVSLAHPVTIRDEKQEALVRRLAALGLDGIEVVHSKHGPHERSRFGGWAKALGLVATGGSDFHGANKPDVELGDGKRGNVRVGPETLAALRQRLP